jgi:hypothetical protein
MIVSPDRRLTARREESPVAHAARMACVCNGAKGSEKVTGKAPDAVATSKSLTAFRVES